jgi:hypothetical protein
MTKPLKHIVMYSGGICSWAATDRLLKSVKRENVQLVFCDTKMEDEDLYRFLHESADRFGCELITITEGRTPWQVYNDQRWLGTSRTDPCSLVIKREFFRKWLKDRYKPNECRLYIGLDWTEIHRFDKAQPRSLPYQLRAPMLDRPYLNKEQMLQSLRVSGIEPPRLYTMGFAHNNCGGFCCKAGQGHFLHLLKTMPDRYRYHEEQENAFRAMIGRDVAILKDRTDGKTRPLTLTELRLRVEKGTAVDVTEVGGCGCML